MSLTRATALAVSLFALACSAHSTHPTATRPPAARPLASPSAFAGIRARDERAAALFLEASRVLLSPRCVNCHPDGSAPTQGDDLRPHDPPVARGADDRGVPGLQCDSCHQDRNVELARVPGAPKWHLAPLEMAWVGRTPRQLCEQLKDRKRNGDKSLDQIVEHSAHDPLVAWGWSPGADRIPALGTQAQLGALLAAWAQHGAACPQEAAR